MFRFLFADPILIAAAIIPAVALIVFIYRQDKIEKEPPSLLLNLVIQGIFATALASVTERLGFTVFSFLFGSDSRLYLILENYLVIALSEEGFKYLLLKNKTWRSPFFNCRFDGVVYAVFLSLGFALWENISYVLDYGFSTALLRAVTAVPGHACFGVFMGAWYGAAKGFERKGMLSESQKYLRLSLVFPVLLHGTYDYIASCEAGLSWVFLLFIAGLFLISMIMIKNLSKKDYYF